MPDTDARQPLSPFPLVMASGHPLSSSRSHSQGQHRALSHVFLPPLWDLESKLSQCPCDSFPEVWQGSVMPGERCGIHGRRESRGLPVLPEEAPASVLLPNCVSNVVSALAVEIHQRICLSGGWSPFLPCPHHTAVKPGTTQTPSLGSENIWNCSTGVQTCYHPTFSWNREVPAPRVKQGGFSK